MGLLIREMIKNRLNRGLIVSLSFLSCLSCEENAVRKNQFLLKDLAQNKNGRNIALMFAAPENLDGPPTDIKKFSELIKDPKYDFNFKVIDKNLASKEDILSMTKDNAKDADTLLWFFSGHGAQDGTMATEDGGFLDFTEVSKVIKGVRTVPLKRLLIFVDACFSGNMVNGANPIITEENSESGVSGSPGNHQGQGNGNQGNSDEQGNDDILTSSGDDDSSGSENSWRTASKNQNAAVIADRIYQAIAKKNAWDKDLYEQVLVLTSSTKDETSADMGADEGGAFTKSLRESFAELKTSKPTTATFRDLVESTTRSVGGGQTPVYKAYPTKVMLDDLLFQEDNILYALLEPRKDPGLTTIWAAGNKNRNISRLILCHAEEEKCKASKTEDLKFDLANDNSVPGRVFYKSSAQYQLKENDVVTLLGLDNNNNVVSSTAVNFSN